MVFGPCFVLLILAHRYYFLHELGLIWKGKKLLGTLSVTNALKFVITYHTFKLTPQDVFESPSDHL